MKAKTRLRLERRWLNLPLHHIDASVIIEAFFEDSKFYIECKNYLNELGYKYRGVLSLSVLGELVTVMERDMNKNERESFFLFLDSFITRRKIEIDVPNFWAFESALRIKLSNYNIDPIDTLHYATAVQVSADMFVTLDQKLINSKILEKEFGLRIVRPSLL